MTGNHRARSKSFKGQNPEQRNFHLTNFHNVVLKRFINFVYELFFLLFICNMCEPDLHRALDALGQELWRAVSNHLCAGIETSSASAPSALSPWAISSPWTSSKINTNLKWTHPINPESSLEAAPGSPEPGKDRGMGTAQMQQGQT